MSKKITGLASGQMMKADALRVELHQHWFRLGMPLGRCLSDRGAATAADDLAPADDLLSCHDDDDEDNTSA